MKKIKLTQNKFVIVDNIDYEQLKQWKWSLHGTNYHYARGWVNGQKVLMHRLILNAPGNMDVDHINGNGLDNRRCNLRVYTRSQNQMNARSRKGTSKYKGIHWNSKHKKWIASIRINGKLKVIGEFDSEVKAAKAYNESANKYFGEFAYEHTTVTETWPGS